MKIMPDPVSTLCKSMAEAHVPQHFTGPKDVGYRYDGQNHFSWRWFFHYHNPSAAELEKQLPLHVNPKRHRDVLNRITYDTEDLIYYVDPADGKPVRMVVQAAPTAGQQGEWKRTKIRSNAPNALRLSTWVLHGSGPVKIRTEGTDWSFEVVARGVATIPLYLFLIVFPIRSTPTIGSILYPSWPGRCYEYPKHAINSLDASPRRCDMVANPRDGIVYHVNREQARLLRPTKLIVLINGCWQLQSGDSSTKDYVFISFNASQFDGHDTVLEERAREVTKSLNLEAYWIDKHYREDAQPSFTDDVHRYCDVVRGARFVCIILPNSKPEAMFRYGERLWTLPEALLARDHTLLVQTMDTHVTQGKRLSLVDMPSRAWCPITLASDGVEEVKITEYFRLLAEHYTGTLTLSRLELIQISLTALRTRKYRAFTDGDIAYALMTLLHKRPAMDPTDSEYEALARLSLANDSDRIVERMICMLQDRLELKHTPVQDLINDKPAWFSLTDKFGNNLWDIEPVCQVAGICNDGGLILDGCRGISIHWSDIPRVPYLTYFSWSRWFAAIFLRSGPIWFFTGVSLLAAQIVAAGAIFFIIALGLLFSAPWTVSHLYGGKVWGAAPILIGFEGTLPLAKIESLCFGNCSGRLNYTPSSGPLSSRQEEERIGAEPTISDTSVPNGQRLFTLIDIVSIVTLCSISSEVVIYFDNA